MVIGMDRFRLRPDEMRTETELSTNSSIEATKTCYGASCRQMSWAQTCAAAVAIRSQASTAMAIAALVQATRDCTRFAHG